MTPLYITHETHLMWRNICRFYINIHIDIWWEGVTRLEFFPALFGGGREVLQSRERSAPGRPRAPLGETPDPPLGETPDPHWGGPRPPHSCQSIKKTLECWSWQKRCKEMHRHAHPFVTNFFVIKWKHMNEIIVWKLRKQMRATCNYKVVERRHVTACMDQWKWLQSLSSRHLIRKQVLEFCLVNFLFLLENSCIIRLWFSRFAICKAFCWFFPVVNLERRGGVIDSEWISMGRDRDLGLKWFLVRVHAVIKGLELLAKVGASFRKIAKTKVTLLKRCRWDLPKF